MRSIEVLKRIKYIESVFAPETEMMKNIAKHLETDNKAIQISPYEGKILSQLVRLAKPLNIVELGSLYGYSLSWILEGMSSQAKVWSVENSKENFDKARNNISTHNKSNQVELVHSSGAYFLENWNNKSKIDFLFIDADKGNYLKYLQLAQPHLSKGAVVVGDNTFLFGHVLNDKPPENYSKNTWLKMKEFNLILGGASGEYTGMMLPTLEGMSIGIKN